LRADRGMYFTCRAVQGDARDLVLRVDLQGFLAAVLRHETISLQ
jgi:hypothetical protein